MPNLKVLGLDLNFKTIIKWKKQKNMLLKCLRNWGIH